MKITKEEKEKVLGLFGDDKEAAEKYLKKLDEKKGQIKFYVEVEGGLKNPDGTPLTRFLTKDELVEKLDRVSPPKKPKKIVLTVDWGKEALNTAKKLKEQIEKIQSVGSESQIKSAINEALASLDNIEDRLEKEELKRIDTSLTELNNRKQVLLEKQEKRKHE